MKRISFTQYDASHIYELMLSHFQDGCFECERLQNRFEDFIGKKEIQRIKRAVKKYPYCK